MIVTATLDQPTSAGSPAGLNLSYEPVDVSQIPSRPRKSGGRTAAPNPHSDVMGSLANTGGAVMIRLQSEQPWNEDTARKASAKHQNWLYSAARDNDRSVRVTYDFEGYELRIYAQDREYKPKPRHRAPDASEQVPGQVPMFSGQ